MKITAELFKQYVGREPEDDDLERCNCDKTGQLGHFMCGWNHKEKLPVYMAGQEEMTEAEKLVAQFKDDLTRGSTIKTSQLIDVALDWAVAQCEGLLGFGYRDDMGLLRIILSTDEDEYFTPSLDWSQGGPIIAREGISITRVRDSVWDAHMSNVRFFESGSTPLIAAMRCYVASKMGTAVEVPNKLLQGE